MDQRWFCYSTFSFKFNIYWTFLQKRAKQGLNSRARDDDPYIFVVHSIKMYMCSVTHPWVQRNKQKSPVSIVEPLDEPGTVCQSNLNVS